MLALSDTVTSSNFVNNSDDDDEPDTPGDIPPGTEPPLVPDTPAPVAPPSVEPLSEDGELPGTPIAPGLSQVPGLADNLTFFLSDVYTGQDYYAADDAFNTVNLTLHEGDLDVRVNADGETVITRTGDDSFAPVFWRVEQVILGAGTNTYDASRATGVFAALSHGGENTMTGGQGTNYLISHGGNALIQGGSGLNYLTAAMGNDTIIGGSGPNYINAMNFGFVAVAGPSGDLLVLQNVPGITTIIDGPGDDEIIAGRGDQITLTGGTNHVEIIGYSPANFGPAIVNGFDPETDTFEFRVAISEFEEDYGTENPAPRDVSLQQRGDDVVIVQSGIEMVRFTGLTLADIDGMAEGRFVQQGDPSMGAYY